MNLAVVLLRVGLAVMPAGRRDRAAEEWRADVDGAAELGLTGASIAVGALRSALAARTALVAARLTHAADACSTVVVGVAIGAMCALADISVLVVILAAGLIHLSVTAVARRRRRATPRAARVVSVE